MKRILIVTQNIYPETFKSSEMAFDLVSRGYKVDVLTGIPNYPEGHYYKGYGLFRKRKEVKEGVTFYRCLQTPRKLLPGYIGLSLNFVTYAINASFWILFFFVWKKKYMAIIAQQTSPVTQVIPACILGRIKKVPVYTWVQDIWPDSMLSTVGDKGKAIAPILQRVTDWVYNNSDKIMVTSKGMIELVNRTRDYSSKIIYFPQWSEDMFVEKSPKSELNKRYTIMMAGSLNDGLGIHSLLALCEDLKNDPVNFIFVGGGSEEMSMRRSVCDKQLNNVVFTGRQPFSLMPSYYAKADAMLLTLKPSVFPHLRATIPARLQSYMSAGKPVLAMIDGSSANLIIESDCGYVVPAGNHKELAGYIRNIVLNDELAFSKKGENSRRCFLDNFTRNKCMDNLISIIDKQ